MTTFAEACAAISARLQANWTATPIAKPNERFDRQEGDWILLELIGGQEQQESIGAPGANLFRHTGLVQLHVFVRQGSGDRQALAHAQTLAAIFRGQTFAGVACEGASIGGGEAGSEDGKWWRRTVSVPFSVDHAG